MGFSAPQDELSVWQFEGDGIASDLTHAQSLLAANTPRVANRPGRPTPVQPVGREEDTGFS